MSKIYEWLLNFGRKICGSFSSIIANVNYLQTGIIANTTTSRVVYGKFNDIVTTQSYGARDSFGVGGFSFGILTGNWYFQYGTFSANTIAADSNFHRFEITNDGKFKIDGNTIYDAGVSVGTPSFELYSLALNNGGSVSQASSFTVYTDIINHNSQEYVYDYGKGGQRVEYSIDGVVQPDPTIQGTVDPSQWGTECVNI